MTKKRVTIPDFVLGTSSDNTEFTTLTFINQNTTRFFSSIGQSPGKAIYVTRKSKPVAVVLSTSDFEALVRNQKGN